MNAMSSMRKDFVASHLRLQIQRLTSVLDNLEQEHSIDHDYAYCSLKEVERTLRQIRKLYTDN